MDQYIGTMLDNRYELMEIIGVGGTAVVYKAKCHRLNRYVAVKILRKEFASDQQFCRQFHDEAQAVAMLSHPNIVNIYDVSRSGSVDYIVMELIDGITLKEYLSRRGQLSPKEVTIFATQIARALEHAHDHDIIHRDIKPHNIMLLRDGTVKVADFGIAHFAEQEDTYSKGEAIGSVHYVSPEQAKGSFVDNRTDLYSLGVVMYEMITGRLPFEGDTPVSIAIQHINSIALPPSIFAEDVPEQLEEITMKAMNPNLSRRYANAGQILADLEAFQNAQQFKLNIAKEETGAATEQPSELDATRKLHNTGEVTAILEAENRAQEQRRKEEQELQEIKEEVQQAEEAEQAAEEPKKKKKQRKERSPLPGAFLFSILAVLVFCMGAGYFVKSVLDPYGTTDDSKLNTPNLVGLYYSQVVSDPQYADFIIVEGEYVYNETVDAGKILEQTPEHSRKIEKGGTITVNISRGAKTFNLPDYANQEARQVKIELERLGVICVENTPEFNDEVPNGYVLRTDPAADTELTAGDTVTLTVSKGPEVVLVDMPDLMGCSENEALTLLEAAGLNWEPVTYEEYEGTPGQVIYQSVSAHTRVEKGTVVSFKISIEPPPPVEVVREITIPLIDSEGLVEVWVMLDGMTVYNSQHWHEEETVNLSLVALEGEHLVEVYQDRMPYSQEVIVF
ncbi:MAG: Stk1 family PASTA domain-containing Ser/Thr kinase [Clostridia bacterium]|nr:Stk1 family PASTA domain-containing Ser/Thr kinase [Clostridia bacterium]